MRLLSICPPEALRPHFQEGYVVGTLDITTEYERKSELDFNRRLIRKFSIPNDSRFWGEKDSPIPKELLYPDADDLVLIVCQGIKEFSDRMARPGDIGDFVRRWSRVEAALRDRSREASDRIVPIGRSIQNLVETGSITRRPPRDSRIYAHSVTE